MNSGKLPPPFVVGEKYWDHDGEYTVTATDGSHVTIEWPDGRRTTANVVVKARIHRNVVGDRHAGLGSDRSLRRTKRRQPTRRESELIDKILRLEADGAEHSGVEIDRLLTAAARELRYSEEDISRLHRTGRGVLANEGDFAKKTMTEERWHEVVGTTAHWQDGARRQCNVYRITPEGLDELRKRG